MANNRRRFEIDETPDKVGDDTINKLQEMILENDPTEFVPADIRNILFCGASRSGKSTVFNVLQNPCYCPQNITMFAETKFTTFKTFSLRDRSDGKVHNFVINLIDTPGTFEVRSSKEDFEVRSNNEIGDLIIDCINHEITYLNLLVLVLNANKFSDTEMDSVDLFLKLFGESKIPILLCLTHADHLGKDRRVNIQKELEEHPRLANYFLKKLFTIQWMGCVNYRQRDYTDEKIMDRDYKLVANWRDQFIEIVFNSSKRVDLETTDIYKNRKKACYDLLPLLLQELEFFTKFEKIPTTSSEHLRLINLVKNMKYLYDHAFYLEKEKTDKNLIDQYHTLHVLIDAIKRSNMDEELKEKVLGPWY